MLDRQQTSERIGAVDPLQLLVRRSANSSPQQFLLGDGIQVRDKVRSKVRHPAKPSAQDSGTQLARPFDPGGVKSMDASAGSQLPARRHALASLSLARTADPGPRCV